MPQTKDDNETQRSELIQMGELFRKAGIESIQEQDTAFWVGLLAGGANMLHTLDFQHFSEGIEKISHEGIRTIRADQQYKTINER